MWLQRPIFTVRATWKNIKSNHYKITERENNSNNNMKIQVDSPWATLKKVRNWKTPGFDGIYSFKNSLSYALEDQRNLN